MRLNSEMDRNELKKKFFAVCGEEFKRGVTVEKLVECSRERGVWDGFEDDLMLQGVQAQIKYWSRYETDSEGRRKYHSVSALDANGKEIKRYKEVAFFDLEEYKVVLAGYEKRINAHVNVYLELLNQVKHRFPKYQHPLPLEVQAYVDAAIDGTDKSGRGKALRAKKEQGESIASDTPGLTPTV